MLGEEWGAQAEGRQEGPVSQGEFYPGGDAGKSWHLKGRWVDFVFYYKNNDHRWIPSMSQEFCKMLPIYYF